MTGRIAIFSGLPGLGSGAERVLEYLLSDPLARDHIGAVIAPRNSSVSTIAADLGCRTLDWPALGDSLGAGLNAGRKFLARRPDLGGISGIHAWHTRGFEIGWALARRHGIKATGTLHDAPDSRSHSSARRLIIRLAANRLNRLAVVSEALKDCCLRQKWKVPMETIPNGLPDDPARGNHVAGPLVHVGFAGLNTRWKGLEFLTEIAGRTKGENFHWHLFGKTSSETQPILQDILDRPEIRVTHHGYMRPEIFFPMIDILFHPSLSFDPYPTVLLEAARAGVPAAASDVGGSREIVSAGDTGILFPPADAEHAVAALRALAASLPRRAAMGENARKKFARDFLVKKMADGYVKFWSRPAGGASR